jgi:hypothetical protein
MVAAYASFLHEAPEGLDVDRHLHHCRCHRINMNGRRVSGRHKQCFNLQSVHSGRRLHETPDFPQLMLVGSNEEL